MKKLNVKNFIKLILFIMCIVTIIHDMYMLTLYSLFTGNSCGFTWFGLVTFISSCMTANILYNYFEEQIKSIHSYQPKHAKDTYTINNN